MCRARSRWLGEVRVVINSVVMPSLTVGIYGCSGDHGNTYTGRRESVVIAAVPENSGMRLHTMSIKLLGSNPPK